MHLAVIGPGRLGRSLAHLWTRAGHTVTVSGRGGSPAPAADVVVLTVPDRALADVAAALGDDPRPVLHCSGASALDVLRPLRRRGSLHPLMTFPGPERALPALDGVPAAVDGSDDGVLELATRLAVDLGLSPLHVPGDRRLYHAAAVMAGNFGTILLALAARTLAAAGVPAERAPATLLPLALASLRHAEHDPAGALTGPIARGDVEVLRGHEEALAEHGLGALLGWYREMVALGSALAAERRDGGDPPADDPRREVSPHVADDRFGV